MPPVTVGQNWSSMARTSTSGNRLRVSKGSRSAGGGSNRRFRRSVSNFSVFPMLRQEERERERERARKKGMCTIYMPCSTPLAVSHPPIQHQDDDDDEGASSSSFHRAQCANTARSTPHGSTSTSVSSLHCCWCVWESRSGEKEWS